jgi:hypothetical protein
MPLLPDPTTTLTLPPCPPVDVPDCRSINPELAPFDTPVLKVTAPVGIPADAATAFAVHILMEPEPALVLVPDCTTIDPPALPPPAMRLTAPAPADTNKGPPEAVTELPTTMLMDPARPLAEVPETTATDPVFPSCEEPVLRRIDPDGTPDCTALAEEIDTDPLPED